MRKSCMERAKTLARNSPQEQWKLGAVIAKGGRIVASGVNKTGRNNMRTLIGREDLEHWDSLHAEINALKSVQFQDVSGMDMYVARVRRDGEFALALPCASCYTALQAKGIRRVYFTDSYHGVGKIVL